MVGPRPKIKFTYQDYKNAPADKRYELLDGDARGVEILSLGDRGFEPQATYGRSESLTSPLVEGLMLNLDEVF